MKAILQDRYGPPSILRVGDIDPPSPREHEVKIRVRAASVNPADWFLLIGKPWVARLEAGLFRPKLPIPGRDVAGEVVAVGAKVGNFRPGDEVFGEISQAYAEYTCVAEDCIALKPENLSFEEAAAIPLAGITALQGLRDQGKVQPGRRVLINGASGGVGTFAIQIAKALGAEVTAVCSTRNRDLVRSLGADHVSNYEEEDFTEAAQRYDVLFDLVGSRPLLSCKQALTDGGVYVCSVGKMSRILKAACASLLWPKRVKVLIAKPTKGDLLTLKEMAEAGTLRPVIDERYPLTELPRALAAQGQGHARGKSIITI